MLMDVTLYLEKDDRIDCRTSDELDAPRQPILRLGAARVYASIGQVAALRDVLDRWLRSDDEVTRGQGDEVTRSDLTLSPLHPVTWSEENDRDCRAEEWVSS